MAKLKNKERNIFSILWEGTKLYLKNFFHLSECMVFPVFGQVIGIFWILGLNIWFTNNLEQFSTYFPALKYSLPLIFLALTIIVAPGFFMFIKAFWEYMIVCVSLNLFTEDIINNKQIKECKIYNDIIKLRTTDYIVLLSLIALIWLVGLLIPLFAFVINIQSELKPFLFVGLEFLMSFALTIVTVYLSLSFQVFAFENYRKPIDVLKRSAKLIHGNFWRSSVLAVILGILTSTVIPAFFQTAIEGSFLLEPLSHPFKELVNHLMQSPVINMFSGMSPSMAQSANLPESFVTVLTLTVIGIIITSFILPYGTACYALLYKDIVCRREKKFKKK